MLAKMLFKTSSIEKRRFEVRKKTCKKVYHNKIGEKPYFSSIKMCSFAETMFLLIL